MGTLDPSAPLDFPAPHTFCRACGHPVEPFLAYGRLPLANALVQVEGDPVVEERFSQTLTFCPACELVQLAETIDPIRLFRHYVYLSSTSFAVVRHAEVLARRLIGERHLHAGSRVIEIASNDGYLLQHYRAVGIPVIGIEPAANIAEIAHRHGVETICRFFTSELARELAAQGKHADIIHAHNVLAHVPDLCDFVSGIREILAPHGVAVIEFPYLRDLVDQLEFDTVYHEHLCYFALTPLVPLFERCGLRIFDVQRIPMHGGSLRLFVHEENGGPPRPIVERMLEEERRWGIGDLATYRRFATVVARLRTAIPAVLADLRAAGRSIAAYGAAAKGATLLNYCAIGCDTIDFVVDLNRTKQGLAMPGVRLPILPPEELLRRQPDFTLLLAWNFADEIVAQQAEYLRRGGRFIMPVPRPQIMAI